jgi:type IV pilus assembly protein PilB
VQVNPKAGLDFARTLRSILRQDPDIVLVGEIRDLETAQIAIRAALTGHFLLSTMHTNNTAASITRLEDMGVPRYLIASSLTGILAQRLLKKICPECKQELSLETLTAEKRDTLLCNGVEKLYYGTGCSHCRNTGYKGRIGIYEYMPVDQDVSDLIGRNVTELELMRFCRDKKNLVTLFTNAMNLLSSGITTLEQVEEVTGLIDPVSGDAGFVCPASGYVRTVKEEKKLSRFVSAPNLKVQPAENLDEAILNTPVPEEYIVESALPKASFAQSKNNTVLIVDDDRLIRQMVSAVLSGQGFSVLEAENGELGLDMISKMGQPGLVILDVRMPVMNGYQFLRVLRENDKTKQIPVIMLTGELEEARELYALEVGADDYLRKPFNPTILLARVNAVIRRVNR